MTGHVILQSPAYNVDLQWLVVFFIRTYKFCLSLSMILTKMVTRLTSRDNVERFLRFDPNDPETIFNLLFVIFLTQIQPYLVLSSNIFWSYSSYSKFKLHDYYKNGFLQKKKKKSLMDETWQNIKARHYKIKEEYNSNLHWMTQLFIVKK